MHRGALAALSRGAGCAPARAQPVLETNGDVRRKMVTAYNKYFKPTNKVLPEAVMVHGMTNEDLKDEPSFNFKDAEEIVEILQESTEPIIGHNIIFDMKRLSE